jgi:dTDP-4-amino-4,6-dideoxygalactose transaminase
VHYAPVPHQPYYRDRYGAPDCPGAWSYYRACLSLPLFPALQDGDVERVVSALAEALGLQ